MQKIQTIIKTILIIAIFIVSCVIIVYMYRHNQFQHFLSFNLYEMRKMFFNENAPTFLSMLFGVGSFLTMSLFGMIKGNKTDSKRDKVEIKKQIGEKPVKLEYFKGRDDEVKEISEG